MSINLKQFDPGNPSLEYLEKRIANNNYRGNVSSQQNRWSFEDLTVVLSKLHKHQGASEYLAIRTADKKKRPQNLSIEFDFARFCGEVVEALGKGSQDAMRKNWFVDWHRAGWIERYTKDLDKLSPYERGSTAFVKVSPEGMKLIDSQASIIDQYFIFSKGIDKLYLGTINVLLSLFREYDLGSVDLHEFTFFVTGVESGEDFGITREHANLLIRDWRRLTVLTRQQIDSYLSKQLVPNPKIESKTLQRDFHNWINKSQQSFSLLKQTIYFEQVNHQSFPHLHRLYFLGDEIKSEAGFAPRNAKRLRRSLQQKHGYFANHAIQKTAGFELHHIVALAWAESQHHFKILDDWRNMIYIDGFSHAKISQNQNLNVKLEMKNESHLSLRDFTGKSVDLVAPDNVLFAPEKLPMMLGHNQTLLAGMSLQDEKSKASPKP